MTGTKGRIAILVAICVLLFSMGGGSYALAKKSAKPDSTSSPKEATNSSATSKGAAHKKPKKHKRKHRIINAQLTVKDKDAPGGFATVTIAKGTLTSSDGQVTVNEDNGATVTVTPASDTKVIANKQRGSVADISSGMKGRVRIKQVSGQPDQVKKVRAHTPKRTPSSTTTSNS